MNTGWVLKDIIELLLILLGVREAIMIMWENIFFTWIITIQRWNYMMSVVVLKMKGKQNEMDITVMAKQRWSG